MSKLEIFGIWLGIFVYLWAGYASWRTATRNDKYLKVIDFLMLVLFLLAAPIPFLVYLGEGEFDSFNIIICKRWLSKKEKIELVKHKLTK